jgi:hypothetical protein
MPGSDIDKLPAGAGEPEAGVDLPKAPADVDAFANIVAAKVLEQLKEGDSTAAVGTEEDRVKQEWLDGFKVMDEKQKKQLLKTEHDAAWLACVEPFVRGEKQMMAYFRNPVLSNQRRKELVEARRIALTREVIEVIWEKAEAEGSGEFFDWTLTTLANADQDSMPGEIITKMLASEGVGEAVALPFLSAKNEHRVGTFLGRDEVSVSALTDVLERCKVGIMTGRAGYGRQGVITLFVKHLERVDLAESKDLWLEFVAQMDADGLQTLNHVVGKEIVPTLPDEVLTVLSKKDKSTTIEKTLEDCRDEREHNWKRRLAHARTSENATRLLLSWMNIRREAQQVAVAADAAEGEEVAETPLTDFELSLLNAVREKGEKGIIALIHTSITPQAMLDEFFEAVKADCEKDHAYGTRDIRKALAGSDRITGDKLLVLAGDSESDVQEIIIGRLKRDEIPTDLRGSVIRKLAANNTYTTHSLTELSDLPDDVRFKFAKSGPKKFRKEMLEEALDAIRSGGDKVNAGKGLLACVLEGEAADRDNVVEVNSRRSHSGDFWPYELARLLRDSRIDEAMLKILLSSSSHEVPTEVAKHLLEKARARGEEFAMYEELIGSDGKLYEITGVIAAHAEDPAILSHLLGVVKAGNEARKAFDETREATVAAAKAAGEDTNAAWESVKMDDEKWRMARIAGSFSMPRLLGNSACTLEIVEQALAFERPTAGDLGDLFELDHLPKERILALAERVYDDVAAHQRAEASKSREEGYDATADRHESELRELDQKIKVARKHLERERFDAAMADPFGALDLVGKKGREVQDAMIAFAKPVEGMIQHLVNWEDKEVDGETINLTQAVVNVVDRILTGEGMCGITRDLLVNVLLDSISDSEAEFDAFKKELEGANGPDDLRVALVSLMMKKIRAKRAPGLEARLQAEVERQWAEVELVPQPDSDANPAEQEAGPADSAEDAEE